MGTVRKMRAVGTCACIAHPEEGVKGVTEDLPRGRGLTTPSQSRSHPPAHLHSPPGPAPTAPQREAAARDGCDAP